MRSTSLRLPRTFTYRRRNSRFSSGSTANSLGVKRPSILMPLSSHSRRVTSSGPPVTGQAVGMGSLGMDGSPGDRRRAGGARGSVGDDRDARPLGVDLHVRLARRQPQHVAQGAGGEVVQQLEDAPQGQAFAGG